MTDLLRALFTPGERYKHRQLLPSVGGSVSWTVNRRGWQQRSRRRTASTCAKMKAFTLFAITFALGVSAQALDEQFGLSVRAEDLRKSHRDIRKKTFLIISPDLIMERNEVSTPNIKARRSIFERQQAPEGDGACPQVWFDIATDLKAEFNGCNRQARDAIRFAFHDAGMWPPPFTTVHVRN